MNRLLPYILLALLPLRSAAQTQESPPSAPPPVALQGVYDNQIANSQAGQWKALNSAQPGNAQLQLNWFRSEYNARSSDNNGALKGSDRIALTTIADDIKASAPGSFEQHLADYYLEFPSGPAFKDLSAAYGMAPERVELLAPMLSKAMVEGDANGLKRWADALDSHGAIAVPLRSAAADVLMSVGANGILFTNGDMDTQPAVVSQVTTGERVDVLIVDQRLLSDAGYRTRVWNSAGAAGVVPGNGPGFAKAILSASARPLYFALSLDRSWLDAFPGELHAVGAVFRVGTARPEDAVMLAKHWASMKKPLDAGPLSRNYLLPGAVLLAHYRAAENTDKATAIEAELERIAKATGALKDLQKAGVLQH